LCGYVEALCKDFRLVLMDHRGHGGSDKPHDPAAYSLPDRVADVVAVLDHLELPKATFWGYSGGGRIGFSLPTYAAERLDAVVIGGQDPYEVRVYPLSQYSSDPHTFLNLLLQHLGIEKGLADLHPMIASDLLTNDFQALAAAHQDEPSLEEFLPRLTMPTLLYAGEFDPSGPKMMECTSAIPNGTFISLEGLSHLLAFWSTDVVVGHVRAFLQRVYAPSDCA